MAEPRSLVARLLATPDIARVVPQLPARVLNELIDRCGLEACTDIVALATPAQLQRVLDRDVWRAPSPGADEVFDGERFGVWLEVLLDAGPEVAAERLAAMDFELVAGGLADHVRVFDAGAVTAYTSLDGELMEHYVRRGDHTRDIGGFVLEARRMPAWHAIAELLAVLHAERPAFFHRVMRACVALSDGERERDGCDAVLADRDQQRADLAGDRETRRDREGFLAAADARAFLQAARELALDGPQPDVDPIARAYLRELGASEVRGRRPEVGGRRPEERGRRPEDGISEGGGRENGFSQDAAQDAAVGAVIELLSEAGVIPPPRALLTTGTPEENRFGRVDALAASHLGAPEELAFLANALLSGCGIHGRAFTPQEAGDAVLATCNLGLEHGPEAWQVGDLITAFRVGWAVLHRDLCRPAAWALIDVLGALQCSDADVQWSLQLLRRELLKHESAPWHARAALEAILMLDPPAWAVLRALLAECPALHVSLTARGRGALTLDPDAVTFAASAADAACVRPYLASLAATLTG